MCEVRAHRWGWGSHEDHRARETGPVGFGRHSTCQVLCVHRLLNPHSDLAKSGITTIVPISWRTNQFRGVHRLAQGWAA